MNNIWLFINPWIKLWKGLTCLSRWSVHIPFFSDWSQYTTFPSHVICILRLKLGSVSKWVERNHSILFLLMDTNYFLDSWIKYIFAKFWQKLKWICFAIEEKDIHFTLYRYAEYIIDILNWYHLNWIMKHQNTLCWHICVYIIKHYYF